GILTATGGKTSHAAVVARGWGKCCIVGCEKLNLDHRAGTMTFGGRTLRQGESITLDGGTGQVYAGCFNLVRPSAPPEYDTLMSWCDQARKLRVHTNADTPADAARAVALGAEGIGLCRTEHMFFDPSEPMRIRSVREMILADEEKGRRRALDKLLGFQRKDFEGVFEAMSDKPVTIRLLDPPLHEFLPQVDDIQTLQELAHDMNSEIREKLSQVEAWDHDLRSQLEAQLIDVQTIQKRIRQLHESNPMLGHRGCRLSITYPEILEMQVRAIMEAAVNCTQRGVKVLPEIMIPLSIDAKELGILINRTRATADAILKEKDVKLKYLVGTMIETPRAALTADRMAEVAEFFSFGTNDLTQLAMALSRDDAGRFLTYYVDKAKAGIFDHDPFQSLDVECVGQLVEMAIAKSRATRPAIKLGICGEHGGDPESILFCHRVGLDYVSCSPLRVPIARLSAAQAALKFDGAGRRSMAVKVKRTAAARPKGKTARKVSARKTKAKVKKASARKTKVKAKKAAKGKKATAKKSKAKVKKASAKKTKGKAKRVAKGKKTAAKIGAKKKKAKRA
ncbi:MAG: pyruvate, phosphate dikinase, partial [Phycisphaerales bacterium]